MSIHLVVIDALNLIRRVHAAQPGEPDVENTAKVCCQTLDKIINNSQPTHIVAVFDHHSDDRGWRAELLPHYKEGRKPMPEELAQGMDKIQDAFMALGIDSLLSDGDEADDLVATLALKVASRSQQVTIISTDKGYCQLLQPTLRVRDYFQQRWLDAPFVKKEYGIAPEQLTDYWGLAGISSSKIPGIAGIGPKAAVELLGLYPDLEAVLSATDLPPKWQKKITGNEDTARASKQVSSLKTDLVLGFNLQDIRYQPPE
ncbi:flap endonuclease Xni [Photobacterium sanguinicancri]|uniref:Flap endonuclease Xni n=1 Tax=Photobacterium sanguinicancri TaxID=875932 RepID=A0ABX4G3V9_9GAMM|nr:flap endonuclease Xni [Photobacterium sanguinicancri]OZS45756.1 flap endonuclease Xni [Photobacterium sanguinicancri]